jgi:hypothetical protein
LTFHAQNTPGKDLLVSLDTTTTDGDAQRVLDAILAGTRHPKDLMVATGYSSSRVCQLLGELTTAGRIHKAGYGCYQAGPAVDVLHTTLPGHARLDPAGLLTVGTHVDGTLAGWPLLDGAGHARHTTILGNCGSGKTVLLRSILLAARAARVDAQVIDIYDSTLRELGYPTATSMTQTLDVLAAEHELATARQHAGDRPLRLLVIDDLHVLEPDALAVLAALIEPAAGARTAIVAGTCHLSRDLLDTSEAADAAVGQELVLLHTTQRRATLPAAAARLPRIPAGLPGAGYLPGRSSVALRAWLA